MVWSRAFSALATGSAELPELPFVGHFAARVGDRRCLDRRGLAGAGSAGSAPHSVAGELDLVCGRDRSAAAGPPVAICLNMAAGAPAPSLTQFQPWYAVLLLFGLRMVNPLDGPVGEEPGWRGFAQPRLQSKWSPVASTTVLGVLITGWHLSKGNEYFLRHLLGTTSNLQAQPAPERLRPNDVAWTDDIPEGKLDLLMSIDFRMTSTTLLSDVVLPAATWYEKADLSSTDMHPFIHAFSPAIDPPWETRSDYRGVRRDRPGCSARWRPSIWVPAPTWSGHAAARHPGAMAYPGGSEHDWRVTGETPVPGKTMGPAGGGGT